MILSALVACGLMTGMTAVAQLPFDTDYLESVLDDVYYWSLDAHTYFEQDADSHIEIHVARKTAGGDEGEWYEAVIPDLNLSVDLAKRNYRVPEMGITVSNATFKIVAIATDMREPGTNEGYVTVVLDERRVYRKLRDKLNRRPRPATNTLSRVRAALEDLMAIEPPQDPAMPQEFYFAPVSSVRNTIWVYWENARKLIRFSSASDFTTDAFWKHIRLHTDIFDLDTDIIVSTHEEPGSNAYITRTWAARILCNCLVDGVSVTLPGTGTTEQGGTRGLAGGDRP